METLTLITTPVTKLVLPGETFAVESNSWTIQAGLRCHAWEIVGETCFAVKLTKTRQKDPTKPFFGRMVLDWAKGNARLAQLMGKA
jgi:hypothetical protein